MRGKLPFKPEVIGGHWSRLVQTDVVAISWRERAILIGECKWTLDATDRHVVRHLIEHTIPNTIAALPEAGTGWQIIPALFARTGAAAEATALLHQHGGMLVDLATLHIDLAMV